MEYDVVETSDIEELEELRAPLPVIRSEKSGFKNVYLSDDFPRKRIKLYHRHSSSANDSLPSTPLAQHREFMEECQPDSQLHGNPTEPTSSLSSQVPVISHTIVNNTTPCLWEALSPSFVRNSSQDPLLLIPPGLTPSEPCGSKPTSVGVKHSEEPTSSPIQSNSPANRSVLSPLFTPSTYDSASKRSHTAMPGSTPPQTNLNSMPSSPLTTLGSPQAPIIQRPTSPMPSLADLVLSPPGLSSPDGLNHRSEQSKTDAIPPVGDIINTSRYSLRQRQPVQLHPYVIDKLHYKQALQDNPDAMITVRSPRGNRRGPLDEYENDEENETQDLANFVMVDVSRSHRRSPDHTEDLSDNHAIDPEELRINYPEILQDLPTTDEDEEEELRALSKEAREVQRKRKKIRKTVLKNAKAYPFTNATKDSGRRTPRGPTTTSDAPEAPSRPPSQSIATSDGNITDNDPPRNSPPLSRSTSPHHPYRNQGFSPDSFQWDNRHSDHDFTHETALPSNEAVEPDHSHDLRPDVTTNYALASKPGRLVLDKKKQKALNHMMPTSMIKNLIRQDAGRQPRKRQLSLTENSGEESEGLLLPGQTRVRKTVPTLRAQEIRGDPESSDNDTNEYGTSSSDVEIVPLLPPRSVSNHEVITLGDSDNDNGLNESSDEGIADEDIQAYMGDDNDGQSDIREVNLIDWMLSRTRTIGNGKRRHSTTRAQRPRKKKYALDIVTGGARKYGRAKQTLLSFDKHTGTSGHRGSRGSRSMSTTDNKELPDAFQLISDSANRLGRKEKAKQRNARRRANGLYVFSGKDNTRIVSGRSEMPSVSVDTVMTVPERSWADAFQPPKSTSLSKTVIQQPKGNPRVINAKNHHRNASPVPLDDDTIPSKTPVTTSIRLLPLGVSFGDETYVGKRRLEQLISAVSMTTRAPQPAPCDLRGYDLHPDMGCDDFLTTLQRICDDFLEFSTGLPEVDGAEHLREWDIITRVVCQMLSWFYDTGDQEVRDQLQRIVEKYADAIVGYVRELNLTDKSLDQTTLQLDWFTVELLARAGCKVTSPGSNTAILNVFHKALTLFVDHLMELGPLTSVNAVVQDRTLTSSTLHQQCAELWVCLIHLFAAFPAQTPARGPRPFWSLVLECLRRREEQSNLKASEKVWETIFCLSALSQFSVYGMTTSHPRLPAAWALVVFAMKQIRLAADPVLDQDLRTAALILRDRYIGVITFRCFQLCDKWRWQLDDASDLFNELGEIFRSRKFANLRHEKPDCPQFMLSSDWSVLSKGAKADSAFTLFLKLVVKAAKPEEPVAELSPKFKKLLSLAIPLGSLPFTKATPPSQQDLSMLFNRYSAVAIGIYLDRASCRTRVSHARTYVAFNDADMSTRMAVIRGMMNLANLIRKLELYLDAMAEWIADISAALSDELKAIPMPLIELQIQGANQEQQRQLAVRCRLHICIQMLLSSIRHILNLFKEDREYPEPTLLASLKSLFTNARMPYERKTMHEIQRLTMVLLDARSNALPPPERPAVTSDINAESQDEYNTNFDFDFNDPSLIAVLGDAEPSANKAHEDKLYHAINETNLYWLCWRHLTKFIQEIDEQPLTHECIRLLDNRIYCWIGCADILVRNGKSWSIILAQRSDVWKITNEALRRRVDLGVAMQLLKLHPMIYSTHVDMFLDIFLESLATEELTIEHDYASLLLTIDGLRHPLFQGLTEPSLGDYNFSMLQYSSLRFPFLQAILNNLNRVLEYDRVSNAPDSALSSQMFIGYFIKGLSAMRSISSSLAQGSETRLSYIKRCKQAFEFIQGLEHICSHPRLTYWISWGRSLETIS